MSNPSPFNSLLVPTDFSHSSRQAFDWAFRCLDRNDSVIVVLHVLDEHLIDTIAAHQFGSRQEIAQRLREQADSQMAEWKRFATENVEIDTIVTEGLPFLEIIRKADDFAVDAIVMGKVGARGHVEKLLFGLTAEKVLRGARRPVIVLPEADSG